MIVFYFIDRMPLTSYYWFELGQWKMPFTRWVPKLVIMLFWLDIPYWRTLKSGGFLNTKYPGGQETHKSLLEKEGHKVIQKGKNFQVQDFQKHLV